MPFPEYNSRFQSQLTAKADDVPQLDLILNSLVHVGDMLLGTRGVTFVHKITAVRLLPMNQVYAYHIEERFIPEQFITVNPRTFLACGQHFVKVKFVHDIQDHIAEVCLKLLFQRK